MLRCAVYLRVSTTNEEQKTSLKNQKDLFIQYAHEKNWSIVDFYIDIESGTSTKRKELNRLLLDLENKRIDVIASKELSRLARNVELSHKIKRIAENNNVHIVTLDGAINTLEGNSNHMFGLYAWIYEQEAERTSERIKYALESRAKLGLFNGSIPPFAYRCEEGKLYIRDDNTPKIVQRIFSEYLQGNGYDKIAMDLYNESIPTPSMIAEKSNCTDKWHGPTIKRILQNQAYIGNLEQLKESTVSVTCKKRNLHPIGKSVVIFNTHKAIVSVEDFKLVQQFIKERTRLKVHQSTHLFTNIIFCADCGKGMHFKKNRRGYVCGSFNKHGKKACTDHIVREIELSELILSDIMTFINSIKTTNLFDDFELAIAKHTSEYKNTLKMYGQSLEPLKIRKSKALTMLIDNDLTRDEYEHFIKENDDKIKELESKILDSKQALDKFCNSSVLDDLTKLKNESINLDELTTELLHRFVSRIEIKENGTARVFYRFSKFQLNSICL